MQQIRLLPGEKAILAWYANPDNPRKASDVAAATGLTVSTVSTWVPRLKKLGLITQGPVLTDAGKELLGGAK